MRQTFAVSAAALAALVLCGCGDDVTTVDDPTCAEGVRWKGTHASTASEGALSYDGTHNRSSLMHPGRKCVACHTTNVRAPALVVAGTVYRRSNDPSDCAGVAGATVEVIDKRGRTFTRTTNSTGNFYIERAEVPDFAMPYRTKVVFGGKTYSMFPETSNGDCNDCHTPSGAQQAQGRVCVDENDLRCTH